jgi:hypothetical protein
MSNKVVEAALQRVRSVANNLRAGKVGLVANELDDAADMIETACADPPGRWRRSNSSVSEVYIDFTNGTIDGSCSNRTAAEMADVLIRIAAELQMMDDTPDYLCYDEGKICSGGSR